MYASHELILVYLLIQQLMFAVSVCRLKVPVYKFLYKIKQFQQYFATSMLKYCLHSFSIFNFFTSEFFLFYFFKFDSKITCTLLYLQHIFFIINNNNNKFILIITKPLTGTVLHLDVKRRKVKAQYAKD